MYEALLVVFLLVAISLVSLIVLLHGKSADMGASFGISASATLFRSTSSNNLITRITAMLATIFFIISLTLDNLNNNEAIKGSKWENLNQLAQSQQNNPTKPMGFSKDIPQ